MNNPNDKNDSLAAYSVHVAREITVTRSRQDVAPKKPRRLYDSPPTIALRRGFSFDATPHMPIRSLLTEELVIHSQADLESSSTMVLSRADSFSDSCFIIDIQKQIRRSTKPAPPVVKTKSHDVTKELKGPTTLLTTKVELLDSSLSLAHCLRRVYISNVERAKAG
jgi:hypothetical protein